MAENEKLGSVSEVTQWSDSIPFRYEYTAGVAGEKFLRGLLAGKILGGYCPNCGETSLPARIYCVRCYGPITKFVKVGPTGRVRAISREKGPEGPRTWVYVTFDGVRGGLIHRLIGKGRAGSRVAPRFRARAERTGSILDIEGFVLVS